MMKNIISELINKGVNIPNPESVLIGDDVIAERISGNGVTIYPGCKITGKSTLILKDSIIGQEGPVTLEECQVGANVKLKGGYFKKTAFLTGASAGSGSHVREGTILEEGASIAHTVGLKQTILFPYVTLGSLINFCDCFMAGGTGPKDHSEVGSSYIHFNYTPNQDKATASLLGDVPKGVLLNQKPIFLGGQGGLVGPCRLNYGTVIAAGTICRKDELRPDRMIFGGASRAGNVAHSSGIYTSIKRPVINNFHYLANLIALRQWYLHIRKLFVSEIFPEELLEGLLDKVEIAIKERVKRLRDLSSKMSESIERYIEQGGDDSLTIILQKKELLNSWSKIEADIDDIKNNSGDSDLKDKITKKIRSLIELEGVDYISVIKKMDEGTCTAITGWLQGIVDESNNLFFDKMPLFQAKN